MIRARDLAWLPAGVTVDGTDLHDHVRGSSWPLSSSAIGLLVPYPGRTVEAAANDLARRFDVSPDAVERDVRSFYADLNAKLLLNVDARGGALGVAARWFLQALRLAPAGLLLRLPRRRLAIDEQSRMRAFATTVAGALRQACAAGTAVFAVSLLATAGLGGSDLLVSLALGGAAGIALAVHEAGHAAALCGVPCCLATAGLRAWVVHPAVRSSHARAVAAAGPTSVLLAAAVALVPAWALTSRELALVALALATQAWGLTVAGRDGRRACGLS